MRTQAHESASVQDTVANWEEERRVSKYADNLPQVGAWGTGVEAGPLASVVGSIWLQGIACVSCAQ